MSDRPPATPKPQAVLALPVFALALVLALVLRGPHLRGPLDDPHSWRQCDTSEITRGFVRGGIDLLQTQVSWLGAHRTLLFEFPLPEAIAASAGRLAGFDPMWDRLVALGFTAIAALYLFLATRELAGRDVARLATVLFAFVPLLQFYSRAAHVDPCALAGAHGLLFHAIRAARGGGAAHVLAGALMGAMAAMVKGPYLAPVLGPLAWVLWRSDAGGRRAALLPVLVSAVAFVLWRRHVSAVNALAPDWTWLPGYYKEVDPWWWYVGSWAERLDAGAWRTLAQRLVLEVATPVGVIAAAVGLVRRPAAPGTGDPRVPLVLWLLATVAYLTVFFPLNVRHNYYQLPFAAPVAVAMALGIAAIAGWARRPAARWAAMGLWLAILAMACMAPARRGYYRVDEVRVRAGEALQRLTPPGALLVAVDRGSEYTDPRLLHRADRHGWAVRPEDIREPLLERLVAEGATHVGWVQEPGVDRLVPPAFLAGREAAREALFANGRDGGARLLAEVRVFTLTEAGSR